MGYYFITIQTNHRTLVKADNLKQVEEWVKNNEELICQEQHKEDQRSFIEDYTRHYQLLDADLFMEYDITEGEEEYVYVMCPYCDPEEQIGVNPEDTICECPFCGKVFEIMW